MRIATVRTLICSLLDAAVSAWNATGHRIIASIASALSDNGINIDSVLQEPGGTKNELPFVVTLEECDPGSLTTALDEIRSLDFHTEPPLALPILT